MSSTTVITTHRPARAPGASLLAPGAVIGLAIFTIAWFIHGLMLASRMLRLAVYASFVSMGAIAVRRRAVEFGETNG